MIVQYRLVIRGQKACHGQVFLMPAFGRNRNAKSRQDKTFIMIILPAQLLGTQLAKTASRGVPN